MYVIHYVYTDEKSGTQIYKTVKGERLNETWEDYIALGMHHDLAKYSPRSILKVENTEEEEYYVHG